MHKHIPNILSSSRIVAALVILVAAVELNREMLLLVILLIILAVFTDWADGYLARKWEVCSEAGYVLDAMGDRAIHLSLTLVVLVRYEIDPIFVWLLIFRDIAIYAIRVLTPNWLDRSRSIQWISRLHALNLRIWLFSFFLRDGVRIFSGRDSLNLVGFRLGQTVLLISTIMLSYWGLGKALLWIWGESAIISQESRNDEAR